MSPSVTYLGDVLGTGAETSEAELAAAAGLVAQYTEKEQFPVRLQLPLMWTVYLMLRFRAYRELAGGDAARGPAFYAVPAGYRRIQLAEVLPPEDDRFYDAREE